MSKDRVVKIFYDLESTGLNEHKHSIHQIAGLVDINNEIVEKFDFKTRPHPKAQIEPGALSKCKVTEEQILAYPSMQETHKAFTKLLSKYVDKFKTDERAWLIGFNNRFFDDRFITPWFTQNGDTFIGSYFYFGLDVQVLAAHYLMARRHRMPSFKLKRVALELGLEIDENRLHDASYDVELTYKIYRIVTGLDLEL
jgi:DNA polymerase-3 subunit epsilon